MSSLAKLIAQKKNVRLGRINTHRGYIDTPAFMPVGTLGTVKGVFVEDLINTMKQFLQNQKNHL